MECDKQHLKGLNLVLASAVCVILVQTLQTQTEISFVMNENRQTKLTGVHNTRVCMKRLYRQ